MTDPTWSGQLNAAGAPLPGFNIIGHLTTSTGMGNAARFIAEMLIRQGHAICGMDVPYGSNASQKKVTPSFVLIDSPHKLPHRYNIICVSIQLLPTLFLKLAPGLLDRRFLNAGLIFWELPVIPPAWIPALRIFDALLVCSDFTRRAIEYAVPEIPTVYVEHPLQKPPSQASVASCRDRFGVPPEAFAFGASFDLGGDITRKNVSALVNVFQKAFPHQSDVALVLKCNGDRNQALANPELRGILLQAESDTRICMITETLPYATVLALYSACDAYLSFHRAEGLGLGPMEAMMLGKPVVATGYSGNNGYMTAQNSILLQYKLIKPKDCAWHYKASFAGNGAVWADVIEEDAVLALRSLKDQPELQDLLGKRAARDINERQAVANQAPFIPLLIRFLEESRRSAKRKSNCRKLAALELFHPILFRKNFGAAITRLQRLLYEAF